MELHNTINLDAGTNIAETPYRSMGSENCCLWMFLWPILPFRFWKSTTTLECTTRISRAQHSFHLLESTGWERGSPDELCEDPVCDHGPLARSVRKSAESAEQLPPQYHCSCGYQLESAPVPLQGHEPALESLSAALARNSHQWCHLQ